MPTPRIPIPMPEIEAFCKKWKITEFSLFGSVLRDDFGPDSDVDVLVTFEKGVYISLFELQDLEEELSKIVGRKAEVVTRQSIEKNPNWIRRKSILSSATQFYGQR
jgi:predicted nucleotidyltransferase